MEEKEFSNVYAIPANYTDSGKLFGGMLETRNTVETGILLFLIGYPELMWMNVSFMIKVIIMSVTLLPVGIVGLMGISGDSLMQFVIHMVLFWKRRRKLHLRRIGYRYEYTKIKRKKRPRPKK
jgi:hypothetical protein